MPIKCTTCHSIYPATTPDGSRYFHACSSLSDAEVAVALGKPADQSTWTAKDRSDVAAAPRVRVNARDENAPPPAALQATIDAVPKTADATYWKTVNAIKDTTMVAAGAGTTIV